MHKTQYADMIRHLIGPSGDNWRELGALEDIWAAMHRDQYAKTDTLERPSILRYVNGSTRYPRRLRVCYQQDDGQQILRNNLAQMIQASTSMARIRAIRDDVYDWAMHQPLADADRIKMQDAYVDGVGPDDIASVLACVLHYVIVHS